MTQGHDICPTSGTSTKTPPDTGPNGSTPSATPTSKTMIISAPTPGASLSRLPAATTTCTSTVTTAVSSSWATPADQKTKYGPECHRNVERLNVCCNISSSPLKAKVAHQPYYVRDHLSLDSQKSDVMLLEGGKPYVWLHTKQTTLYSAVRKYRPKKTKTNSNTPAGTTLNFSIKNMQGQQTSTLASLKRTAHLQRTRRMMPSTRSSIS